MHICVLIMGDKAHRGMGLQTEWMRARGHSPRSCRSNGEVGNRHAHRWAISVGTGLGAAHVGPSPDGCSLANGSGVFCGVWEHCVPGYP